jgi:coproporphyrinogen III oxidase-like Fe-S oxidoreductase
MDDYAAACAAEAAGAGLPPATSVYFGGGTPSLLPPALLAGMVDAIPRRPDAEITVEANPETVTPALLEAYVDAGVNRISMGVQSMDPPTLASLGRGHDPAAVYRAVAAVGSVDLGRSYSVDLIYGAAGESQDSWRRTVEQVLALDPAPRHVSAYALTPEPGTPLARDANRHPDPDDQAAKYEVADALLAAAGLQWYEISNWAAPGAESRHNQLYWDQGEYRGIGCSAHSHAASASGARRWWNVRTPDRYIGLVGAGESPEAAGEDLDEDTRRLEALQLALRTRRGVPAGALEDDPAIEGLVARSDGRAVLTRSGRLLANEVAMRLRA